MRGLAFVTVCLCFFSAARAEEQPSPTATPVAPGSDVTSQPFGAWAIVCYPTSGAKDKTCEVSLTVTMNNQTPVARLAIARPTPGQAASVTALLPVNVSTAAPVKLLFDHGKLAVTLPLQSCLPTGCVAKGEIADDQLQAMREPMKSPGQLVIVDASGQPGAIILSVNGLDEALNAYLKPAAK